MLNVTISKILTLEYQLVTKLDEFKISQQPKQASNTIVSRSANLKAFFMKILCYKYFCCY